MALLGAPADPLLDRAEELAAISDALASARDGTGTMLVLAGGSGIGKTRLLGLVLELAAAEGMRCLSSRGGEFEQELPFGVVRQLFEPVLARADPGERERLLDGAAALAAPAVDPAADPCGAPASFATLHGLYWLTASLAADQPLVVAVDDAHWVDAPSLRFGVYLARRLEGLPLLLVVAVRTGEPRGDELLAGMSASPPAVILAPRALGEDAVASFVGERLDRQPDADFTRACHAATGGNPLLLRELVLELCERGVPPVTAEAAGIGEMAIDRVARPVLRRLGSLPEGAGELARAVAILGDRADLPTAARVADLPQDRAARLADSLAAAGILDGGARLEFVHPLVRSAIAGALGPGERGAAHRRAARALAAAGDGPEEVAAHLAMAPPAGEAWALEAFVAAGRLATSRGAPDAAAAFLRRALEETPDAASRQNVLLELGTAEARASEPAAIDHLEQALAAAEPPARARAALALGGALYAFGRFTEATRVYERALDGLDESERALELELEAELLSAASLDLSTRSLMRARVAHIDPELAPTSRAACKLLANLAREEMATGGSRERAVALAERSLSGGFLMAEEPLLTFLHPPVVLAIAGELGRALQVYDEALVKARARGSALSASMLAAPRSFALHQCGRLAEAAAEARGALEVAEAQDAPLVAPYAAGFLASTLMAQGKLDDAQEVLDGVAHIAAAPETFSGVHVLSIRGRLRAARGALDEAAADLSESGRRLDALRLRNPGLAPWRGELALVEQMRGRGEAARELAAEQLALARAWGAPWVLARALRIAGLVEGGDAGGELLREAIDSAAGGSARLERARALVELGALLRRSGQRKTSREFLREGLDLALACGATPLAERAHGELVSSGAHPRRLRTSGPDSLTPAERRVAGMAAESMTNRAIAQALFVSEKTVETHLRGVFRKLDISSRSQLTGALGD